MQPRLWRENHHLWLIPCLMMDSTEKSGFSSHIQSIILFWCERNNITKISLVHPHLRPVGWAMRLSSVAQFLNSLQVDPGRHASIAVAPLVATLNVTVRIPDCYKYDGCDCLSTGRQILISPYWVRWMHGAVQFHVRVPKCESQILDKYLTSRNFIHENISAFVCFITLSEAYSKVDDVFRI